MMHLQIFGTAAFSALPFFQNFSTPRFIFFSFFYSVSFWRNTALPVCGLGAVLNRKAGKLSGGWQRRISIAMALISEPKILFLDEPTLGLDVIARSELWDMIYALKGKVTIILTTHYMEEAEALSDRVGIMKDGRLIFCDTPDGIKRAAGEDSFERAFVRIVKGVAE